MQCPICGFENLPGVAACVGCRAQLLPAGPAAAGDFQPPRSRTPRLLRALQYQVNRIIGRLPTAVPKPLARFFVPGSALPGDRMAALCLSALPGLGQLLDGRRRRALAAFAIWLLLVVLAVNFYAGIWRVLLMAALVSFHSLVAFDAGRVAEHAPNRRDRVAVMLSITLVALTGYYGLDLLAHRWFNVVSCPYGVKGLGLEAGDDLVVRNGGSLPARGDLITLDVSPESRSVLHTGGGHYAVEFQVAGLRVARVLAVGGDDVVVSPGGLRVNGRAVGADELPGEGVPLPAEDLAIKIPGSAVLAVSPTHQLPEAHRAELVAGIWQNTYMVPRDAVRGRAVGVYLPLSRRHFFARGART